MRIIVCDDYEKMSQEAAKLVAAQVNLKPNCVLGLATGSTPVRMYQILAEMNKNEEVDFSDVTSFNLDEYYPISRANDQSYYYFMNENLFSKINIDKDRTHVPNGEAKDAQKECEEYDKNIDAHGGIDLQILGIGQNGHIAFNEPGENLYAGTHVTGLTQNTIEANSRFFNDISEVPTQALTMGIASILKSRRIVIMANGKNKHDAVAKLLTDEITTSNPATMLKVHTDVTLICDKEAYFG